MAAKGDGGVGSEQQEVGSGAQVQVRELANQRTHSEKKNVFFFYAIVKSFNFDRLRTTVKIGVSGVPSAKTSAQGHIEKQA